MSVVNLSKSSSNFLGNYSGLLIMLRERNGLHSIKDRIPSHKHDNHTLIDQEFEWRMTSCS